MKVAILTLKIHSNFGYLMQLYALQRVIKSLGHEPYTFFIKEEQPTFRAKVKDLIYNLYVRLLKGQKAKLFKRWFTENERCILDKNTWDFVRSNVQLTEHFKSAKDFYNFDITKFDAYIVGSDQVWREPYSMDLPLYFFSFLDSKTRRMSYAASFGRSDIKEYSSSQITQCKQLLQRFNIVTVREKDGVDICKKEFGVDAKQVVDPTLLLSEQEYEELANKGKTFNHGKPYVFTYLLDPDNDKIKLIKQFSKDKNMEIVNILPPKKKFQSKLIEEFVYPHVYDILSGFKNASFVFTDSFHASVFSIIFKRQFFVFPNEKRGVSRITSLLADYNLSDRIITGDLPFSVINFDTLNISIKNKVEESKECLKSFFNER